MENKTGKEIRQRITIKDFTATVKVAQFRGEKIEVSAVVEQGLAVTPELPSREAKRGALYGVTHVKSGRKISGYSLTLTQAWRVLLASLPFADWTKSATAVRRQLGKRKLSKLQNAQKGAMKGS